MSLGDKCLAPHPSSIFFTKKTKPTIHPTITIITTWKEEKTTAKMGRELQKKKNRSSIPKKTKRKNPRVHKVRPLGNALIAQNWDKKQTLAQNYKRLGLVSRLNGRAGGQETPLAVAAAAQKAAQKAATAAPASSSRPKLAPGEAFIERDEDGNVVKIVYGKSAEEALNDNEEEEEEEEFMGIEDTRTDIVKQLEAQAAVVVKRERSQSSREKEWVEVLVKKYGKDYSKMARDRKLNPFQQSAGELKRRVEKWEKSQKKAADAADASATTSEKA
ncbi:ribosome biogenesis protein Nop16-domain-containing protein [Morchella snyderi]|nr:ribosome biogenesis protein Nop16-domain-containing protein [Morchella snyderi]